MNIAVITGASSGIGREFARQIALDYPWLDQLWLIGRSIGKLEQVKKALEATALSGTAEVCCLSMDLTIPGERKRLAEKLEKETPRIKLLVNAAGMGVIGKIEQLPAKPQLETIRINCEALTAVTHMCLPYLKRGSRIIQMVSASAFVPQPEFAVYAASKAYALSFSRALRKELQDREITVTAVCPGPVDTPFFDRAEQYEKRLPAKRAVMAEPGKVVKKAIRDAATGREISVCGLPMKGARAACKLLPHSLIIRLMDAFAHSERRRERTTQDAQGPRNGFTERETQKGIL
ncbi:MAG: SDR family NAD(P)-dependent oxidoreductase [Candidatus Limivivens sp.]|nr:SDR family NAD(P)-dependent oxidoreductase [Candidatus Limivivens sp.]